MPYTEYLFNRLDSFSVIRNKEEALLDEIAKVDPNHLLNTPVEDLCDYFVTKYRIDVPALRTDEIAVSQHEKQIKVMPNIINGASAPFYSVGTTIEAEVPFLGDKEVFNIKPSQYTTNRPHAEIRAEFLILRIEGVNLKPDAVRERIDQTISTIEQHLSTLRANVASFNGRIRDLAKNTMEQRRKKLLADQNLVSAIGFKIKERSGIPRTFVAPEVRRKITPNLPPANNAPYKPDPTLSATDYDHILDVIQNMANVMELSPSAF